jgi:hypothetical protein
MVFLLKENLTFKVTLVLGSAKTGALVHQGRNSDNLEKVAGHSGEMRNVSCHHPSSLFY